MSEERLKEIKDSIDFQVDYMKSINFDNVILNEEKELYDEVIRLNNIINELEKWLEYSINEHTNVIKSNNDIYWETIQKEKYEDRILIMSLVLNKLEELKGGDKE